MKKLMIAAAAAAMICGVKAATLDYTDCETPENPGACDILVFKLTASGKAVQDVNEGAYKSVKSLKISKGALALIPDADCAAEGKCCYNTATIFAQLKLGSAKNNIYMPDLVIGKWSIFGKNFTNKVYDYMHDMKKGSSVTVESDIFFHTEGSAGDYTLPIYFLNDGSEVNIDLWASAFGSVTAKLSAGKAGSDKYCDPEDEPDCVLDFTPKTYSGWFVGAYEQAAYGWCFTCDCGEYDVCGGTWKAVFQKSKTTLDAAQKLGFGAVVLTFDEDGQLVEEE